MKGMFLASTPGIFLIISPLFLAWSHEHQALSTNGTKSSISEVVGLLSNFFHFPKVLVSTPPPGTIFPLKILVNVV